MVIMPNMPGEFAYVGHTCENEQDDIVTSSGLRGGALVYRVARRSTGKVLRESVWDLRDHNLFLGNRKFGKMELLIAERYDLRIIFNAALEASARVKPFDVYYGPVNELGLAD